MTFHKSIDSVRTSTYHGARLFPHSPMTLTSHQKTALTYIREFQKKRGYSPSLSDLAIAFGVRSKNAIAKVVNALVHQGFLQKDPKGRIKIIDDLMEGDEETAMQSLFPLFGPIPAGFAAPVEEQAEERISFDEYLVRDKAATFLLRVKGSSMINAGIFDGDLVVVERGKEPRVEEIVVGILDGQYTLKRLKKDKGKFYFQAENPDFPNLHPMEELQVAGVVRGILRKY